LPAEPSILLVLFLCAPLPGSLIHVERSSGRACDAQTTAMGLIQPTIHIIWRSASNSQAQPSPGPRSPLQAGGSFPAPSLRYGATCDLFTILWLPLFCIRDQSGGPGLQGPPAPLISSCFGATIGTAFYRLGPASTSKPGPGNVPTPPERPRTPARRPEAVCWPGEPVNPEQTRLDRLQQSKLASAEGARLDLKAQLSGA